MSNHGNKSYRRRRPYNKDGDADDTGVSRSETHRRRQAAISLNSFSSKKGHDRALQEYKKRKETKFQKNATLLREYQRAMKQEGYEVGKGASRWRNEEGRKGSSKKRKQDTNNDDADDTNNEHHQSRTKRHKSDPLLKARKHAEARKAEKAELINQKETKIKNESKKQHDRKVRAKKLMKRTRKGQPVMKNVIGDLLGKIKSDMGEK